MKTVSKIALLAILIAISFTPHLQAQDFEAIGKRLVTQLAARQFDQVEAQFDDQMKAGGAASQQTARYLGFVVGTSRTVQEHRICSKGPFGRLLDGRIQGFKFAEKGWLNSNG